MAACCGCGKQTVGGGVGAGRQEANSMGMGWRRWMGSGWGPWRD